MRLFLVPKEISVNMKLNIQFWLLLLFNIEINRTKQTKQIKSQKITIKYRIPVGESWRRKENATATTARHQKMK